MWLDKSEHFDYHPGGGMTRHQPPAASHSGTNPPASNPWIQQSNGFNPWTNGPATAPSAMASHHYVYNPPASNTGIQQSNEFNPWTNGPATAPSAMASHHYVYNPSSSGSTSPAPMYYPGGSHSTHVQFHLSQPAAEPANFNNYQGLTTQQVNDRNISRAQSHGGFNQVQLVPQNASPDNKYFCRGLDGTWTEETFNTITNSLNPGKWAISSNNYLMWIRLAKE